MVITQFDHFVALSDSSHFANITAPVNICNVVFSGILAILLEYMSIDDRCYSLVFGDCPNDVHGVR